VGVAGSAVSVAVGKGVDVGSGVSVGKGVAVGSGVAVGGGARKEQDASKILDRTSKHEMVFSMVSVLFYKNVV
jgi:UDP-3-O-[3-hydroxymyristoyl] glucosamine N-acyltransferase